MDFMFTSQNILESFMHYNSSSNSSWDRANNVPLFFYEEVQNQTKERLDGLVKPKGSLGQIEDLLVQLSGITGDRPSIDPAAIAIFVSDHGIAADDSVTPWPQDISTLMADLITEGKAAASVIAKVADTYVEVINVGLINSPSSKSVRNEPVAKGTRDFRQDEAMSIQELMRALEIGADTAERLVAGGSRALAVGEVGIGNTTSAAILIGHVCRVSAESVTGRGSGIPDEIYSSKLKIIENSIRIGSEIKSELEILAKFGGFEIAAMVGFIIRAATLKVPIILDGISTLAAALIAHKMRPEIRNNLIAGHLSTEPASKIAISHLGLNPILSLELRLGEGTGALLSIPILRTACSLYEEMGELSEILGKIKKDN
jgi:nicotinate-nucleotide--dimethylbenzimidazole phosphoribosyltransferase